MPAAKLDRFLNYIRMRKVVMLEDLASDFYLKTHECIDRIRSLEEMGRIDGFFDDRGKYIYLEEEEMRACAHALLEKGRIDRSELVTICNSMIRMEPTAEDIEKIQEEERRAVASLDWEE